jgi:hypothetical protein
LLDTRVDTQSVNRKAKCCRRSFDSGKEIHQKFVEGVESVDAGRSIPKGAD